METAIETARSRSDGRGESWCQFAFNRSPPPTVSYVFLQNPLASTPARPTAHRPPRLYPYRVAPPPSTAACSSDVAPPCATGPPCAAHRLLPAPPAASSQRRPPPPSAARLTGSRPPFSQRRLTPRVATPLLAAPAASQGRGPLLPAPPAIL
jgi:hypothetical protein